MLASHSDGGRYGAAACTCIPRTVLPPPSDEVEQRAGRWCCTAAGHTLSRTGHHSHATRDAARATKQRRQRARGAGVGLWRHPVMGSRAFPRSCITPGSFAPASRALHSPIQSEDPAAHGRAVRASVRGCTRQWRVQRPPPDGHRVGLYAGLSQLASGEGRASWSCAPRHRISLPAESPAPHVRHDRRLRRWSPRAQARSGSTQGWDPAHRCNFAHPVATAGPPHHAQVACCRRRHPMTKRST